MILSELFEAPYHHDGIYKGDGTIDRGTFISDGSLSREYKRIATITVDGQKIDFFELSSKSEGVLVRGTIKSALPKEGEPTNRVIFALRFKKQTTIQKFPEDIDKSKCLQVDSVYIAEGWRGLGISSLVYQMLVERGVIVISDNAQFLDGKELWKNLVRKSTSGEYKIYILDDEYGFITKNGEPLVYDGKNIDDAKIWSSGDNFDGFHKLLVMKA